MSKAMSTEIPLTERREFNMYSRPAHVVRLVAILFAALMTHPLVAQGPAFTDPSAVDEDFAFQGEYVGEVDRRGEETKIGVQVIALGKGEFRAVAHFGGLPGDGWDRAEKQTIEGHRDGDRVLLLSERGRGEIEDGQLSAWSPNGELRGRLKKVQRKSSTLGKKPPENAVVLFDGSSALQFGRGRVSADGLLMAGATSNELFGDHFVHIEFRLPYQPESRGQKRGNSGIYVQGRYEVQMLDSFGLEGKNNECGGIYTVRNPDINMCFPPLTWQTYDIEFRAARFAESGKLLERPRITVRHNGVLVHNDIELPGDESTRAALLNPGPAPGPVYLQDHGDPVRYRNIWVVRSDSSTP